jgi:hypothetical protein
MARDIVVIGASARGREGAEDGCGTMRFILCMASILCGCATRPAAPTGADLGQPLLSDGAAAPADAAVPGDDLAVSDLSSPSDLRYDLEVWLGAAYPPAPGDPLPGEARVAVVEVTPSDRDNGACSTSHQTRTTLFLRAPFG